MKKKHKLVYLGISTLLLFIALFIYLIQNSQSSLTLKLKSKLPKNIRYFIKDSINFYLNNTAVNFKYLSEKSFITEKGKEVLISEFNNKLLDYQGPRAYISMKDNKIFLTSGTGIVGFVSKKQFYKNKNFKFNVIKSNIKELVTYDDFYRNSNYGVKGMILDEENIYISLSNLEQKDCVKISIIKAKIDYNKLNFSYIFNPKECVKKKNTYGEFQPIQSGGAMFEFDKENILLSTGEFRFRDLAQTDTSIYGKVLKVNKFSGEYSLISKGHRNIQGLYYDDKKNIIISTEHGPLGGDEININKNIKNNSNFGWPISSYGEHYPKMAAKNAYEKAPLHKSHSAYGFIEPIKYFVPSIGITQIVKFPNKEKDKIKNEFYFSSMGYADRENSLSIHQIIFDENYDQIIFEDKIKINYRIRDLLVLDNKNILAYLEKKGSLIKVSFNE